MAAKRGTRTRPKRETKTLARNVTGVTSRVGLTSQTTGGG